MEISYYDLQIVPPMDLNQNLPNIDRISPFPMQLRTHSGIGLFGARRSTGNPTGLIRFHGGIDLLAPVGTPVFAVGSGLVSKITGSTITINHDSGFKFLSFYSHVQNIGITEGDYVEAGDRICEVGDWSAGSIEKHLHFEIRYVYNDVFDRAKSFTVDMSMRLFDWERTTYQNDANSMEILDNTKIERIGEVVQGRNLRFLQINLEKHKRNIYLPLMKLRAFDKSMLETIKMAFFNKSTVKIVCRESLFYSKIDQQNSAPNNTDRISIIEQIFVS